jgi:DNA-binding response OmpR family regulator
LESPDLVVSEIDLPDLTGLDVCCVVKSSLLTKTPVVLVGRPGEKERDSASAAQSGADAIFTDLSDARYILGKLEWFAARSAVGYGQRIDFPALRHSHVSSGAMDVAGEPRFD